LYIQADGNITIFRVPDEKSQTAIDLSFSGRLLIAANHRA
jgi:hypothetical protein